MASTGPARSGSPPQLLWQKQQTVPVSARVELRQSPMVLLGQTFRWVGPELVDVLRHFGEVAQGLNVMSGDRVHRLDEADDFAVSPFEIPHAH